MPVTYDRYPGTSGSTHGDRKLTSPAAAATATATSSGPLLARCAKEPPMSGLRADLVDQPGQVGLLDRGPDDRRHPALLVDDERRRERVRRYLGEAQR